MKARTCSVVIALPLCVVLQGASSALAVVWNVNPAGTGDAPTIQAAFDLASPGDVILLAPGSYTADNTRSILAYGWLTYSTSAVAHMSPDVDITSSGGAEVTFIDGETVRHGLVGADLGSVEVSGISFVRGRSNGDGGGTEIWGGGFLAYRSTVLLEHNRFVDCVANDDGGDGGGGGALLQGGSNCVVRFNLFLRNFGSDLGGGLELFETSSASVSNNTFVDNVAERSGGALLINNTTADVSNNIFASSDGGFDGGAVGCLNATTVTSSCNLFWDNTPSDVNACTIVIGVNNNSVGDPLFCDASADDYTIATISPAAPTDPSGCGLRGAYGVACGTVSVVAETWGGVKARYRPGR
jgi:hypothetical protein